MTSTLNLVGQNVRGLLGSTYTSRIVDVEKKYPEAVDWMRNAENTPSRYGHLERELIGSLRPIREDDEIRTIPLFRGRPLSSPAQSYAEFGPPPAGRNRAGRYNDANTRVLYLSTSTDGVRRELQHPRPGEEIWVQQYKPLGDLNVADARSFPDFALAEAVFYLIESERGETHPLLGQRIGSQIARAFDGLLVPGVRAESNTRYFNVVLFRPHENDRWTHWVDSSANPQRLSQT